MKKVILQLEYEYETCDDEEEISQNFEEWEERLGQADVFIHDMKVVGVRVVNE